MSPSSSRSYLPPDPAESNNETSYAPQPRQEPVRQTDGPADPQLVDVLTPLRTGVNGGPAGPPSVSPPQVPRPPVAPLGGERGFDPLTSSWPGVGYDPPPSSWQSPGAPVPDNVAAGNAAAGFAVVDRYTTADNIAANNVGPRDAGHDTAGSWPRPSFNPLADSWAPGIGGNPQPVPSSSPPSPSLSPSPASDTPGMSVSGLAQNVGTDGSGAGNAPAPDAPGANAPTPSAPDANGRSWTRSSTYDPLFDRKIFPGGFTSAPPSPADHQKPAVPFRHEERPDVARRPFEPSDTSQNHAGQNRADQGHREQNRQERNQHKQTHHLPYTPVPTQYPAPASPLPAPVEQPAGPSTAPLTMVPDEDPPFQGSEGYRNEHQPNLPFPETAGVNFPYPDNPYPSTEYPAPPPGIRPGPVGQRLRDNDFRAAGGPPEQNGQNPHDNNSRIAGGFPERNSQRLRDNNSRAQKPNTRTPVDGASGRLMTSALLPTRPDIASRGWRRILFKVSGGTVKLGPSADEARHRRLVERISTPLNDCHRIAVMSLKGGVGKTTTAVGLGSTLASLRGDRVVAIDANPDRGTLGAKVPRTSENTVRDLLDNADSLRRYVDVRRYLSQAGSRLEVLASANAPEISQAFADTDYVAVDDILQRYYSILLTDCGTGMLHSAMPAILELADTLVIVSSSSADGGSSASATLDWLEAHGYAAQVRNAVTVISTFPANRESVDLDTLEQHFAARTRRVVQVPYDPHLAVGGRIALEEMRKPTRKAFLEIAGAVAEQFGLEGQRARDDNLFARSEAEIFGASEGQRAHDNDFSVHSETPGNPAGREQHDHASGAPGALSG